MSKLTHSTFRPAWWLQSPHLQTLWPVFFRPRPKLKLQAERVELKDGDFIDLAWHPRPNSPLVLVIHGLEGSLRSHYAQTLLLALHNAGFASVFMHLRGCSGTPNRHASSYHSGRTADVAEVLAYLHASGRMPDAAVGFSLGGNLILKYAGETGAASGLKAIVAVSTPFQLQECARKLEHGFARVYGQYLLRNLKGAYRRKFSQRQPPLPVKLDALGTIFAFDDQVTAPLNGFAGAEDYYARSSSGQFLSQIQTPALIIHAQDDPFMYPSTVPDASMLSDSVTLELAAHGGHVGFVGGNAPWRAEYWLEQRITRWLQGQLADGSHTFQQG
ncbi:hydrolase [Candidatus Thiothrix sp. Deng01]|uniref:Hydrolase n=1 Tax=Candidatus Thiothrix phosphatis TaxID=3112415 RepID=A0ABU6CUL4_9GAMM|nr:hydrolase [Candidatus Thiothrix sp. Deng01]MEB4590063.1 hydrolase [Candidatus Thiothrix sp. Deng01]